MTKTLIGVLLLAVGAALGFAIGRDHPADAPRAAQRAPDAPRSAVDFAPAPPKFTAAQVQSHRETLYIDLKSVDDVISLPTDFAQTEALFALAGRADVEALQGYITEAERIAHRWDRRAALQVLFLRYVELDAAGAIDYLQNMRLDIDMQIMDQMFQSWSKTDLNAAIDAANRLGNVQRRRAAGAAILRAYSQNDPGMLSSVEASLIDNYDLGQFERQALAASASYAPQTALQEALAITNTQERRHTISSIGHVWARQDPAGALAHADSIADQQLRQLFRHAVLNRWAGDNPDAAMQVVLNMPAGRERDELVGVAMNSLSASDPDGALLIADQLTGRARDSAYQTIFRTWASNDPRGAALALDNLPNTTLKTTLVHSVAYNYVRSHPDEALQWARSIDAPDASGLWDNVLGALAQTDPHKAIQVAMQSDTGDTSNGQLTRLLSSIANNNPQLASNYVSQLPAGQQRNQAYAQIASQWASRDPDAAMDWIGGLSGDAYNTAMLQVVQHIAWRDPDKAAQYLPRVSGEARQTWIGSIAEAYAGTDPQRAVAWVSQFKGNPGYSGALLRVVPQLAQQDPMAALSLAASIDSAQRPLAVQSVMHSWSERDPAAAARWAERSATPEQRGDALRAVASNWAYKDRRAATRWATGLPSGNERDEVFVILLGQHGASIQEKRELLSEIDSQSYRDQAIANIFLEMLNSDPAAAQDFLKQSSISPQMRLQLGQYSERGH